MRAVGALALSLAFSTVMGCSRPIDSRFSITASQLPKLLAGLSEGERSRVLADPAEFLALVAGALEAPAGTLTLVDKAHALPDGWEPPDLVALDPKALVLARGGLELRAVAVPDLVAMSDAARAAGVELPVSSTWRSYAYQVTLWKSSVRAKGLAQTARELAEPGHSQHQLGTAVDFGSIDDSFARTPASAWLAANAWRYGWSLSYPEGAEARTGYMWEPWHYRWVGRPAADLAHRYFADGQQRFLEFWSQAAAAFAARRVQPRAGR
jgi:D-alanyl-D-alanine carboxypeptidase